MITLSNAGYAAAADGRAIVRGPGYRFTVLTSRLIRMEWDADEAFVDMPTPMVVDRRFDVPGYSVRETPGALDLWTEHLHVHYDLRAFSPTGLAVTMRTRAQGAHATTWHFGDPVPVGGDWPGNLGGTARTLDGVDGACEIEPGILSRHGYAVVDDSTSVQLTPDGWFAPRPGGSGGPRHDLYFFGYGLDFTAALQDYLHLTGPSPLVPRAALGNWWSRYHRYTADGYLALMDRFAEQGVPLSVAVLDMDWHVVDIDPSLGSGWTGYTWNRELFPDPEAFLAALHERGLMTCLNVHPADGVRRHEDAYPDVARDMGIDPDSGLEVAFDITSRTFVDSYLERLHHPLEEQGVDLWWLDWQSGGLTRVPGLDPLWMLNHIHFVDSGRDGDRPLTFSRYAGLGSHRYPVGFSGDTIVSWASLDFQPYFTATAANVGYFWWSHDVGGHMFGAKDDELAARWYQLGALSPVNRLHSSASPFNSKEPWRFSTQAETVMARFLRLRHLLVPYLYTAAWAAHTDGVGVVRPMYHDHPTTDAAFGVPHQYLLGADLLVAPITTPVDRSTHLAQVRAWLPEGTWFDAFTGRRYTGGRDVTLHRALDDAPVLARAGAVIPLLPEPGADVRSNPEALVLRIFPGASGEATLHEDDGHGSPTVAERQETTLTWSWTDRGDGLADAVLVIGAPTGPGALERRTLTLDLVGVTSVDVVDAPPASAEHDESGDDGESDEHDESDESDDDRVDAVRVGGEGPHAWAFPATPLHAGLTVELGSLDLSEGVEVRLVGVHLADVDVAGEVFAILDRAQIEYAAKERAFTAVTSLTGTARAAALHALDLPGNLYGAVLEVLAASDAR
ncbi:MAG: glycoside hydrolase [Cellulomonadaceae bacterium]|nr:glycoside hydrolase [Cellulomonadaceae bacterium]